MKKLTAASPDLTGPTNHSDQAVWFVNGVAYLDDGHPFVGYASGRDGYTVEPVDAVPADHTAAIAQMKAPGSTRRLGGRLRDAAVDPRPGDASAPVNAGKPGPEGNPHGPHVRAPQALTPRGPGRHAPGRG